MNYSTAVMLINENIRAISCIYVPDEIRSDGRLVPQTHYIFKSLDKTLKPGDYVVVPTSTRHGMTVVQVAAVDVDVNFESSVELKWIICKVDVETNKQILLKEQEWIAKLQHAERQTKRQELKEKMLKVYSDELKVIEFTGKHDASVLEHAAAIQPAPPAPKPEAVDEPF